MLVINPLPSTAVITFTQMQQQLRLDDSSEQQYVLDLIAACTAYCETATATSLITRTITIKDYRPQTLKGLLSGDGYYKSQAIIPLPFGPVQETGNSIVTITDANGAIASTNYQLQTDGTMDFVYTLAGWQPPLTITYNAGYGASLAAVAALAPDLLLGIRTHVASLFRVRESVTERTIVPCPHSLDDFYNYKKRAVPFC